MRHVGVRSAGQVEADAHAALFPGSSPGPHAVPAVAPEIARPAAAGRDFVDVAVELDHGVGGANADPAGASVDLESTRELFGICEPTDFDVGVSARIPDSERSRTAHVEGAGTFESRRARAATRELSTARYLHSRRRQHGHGCKGDRKGDRKRRAPRPSGRFRRDVPRPLACHVPIPVGARRTPRGASVRPP